MSGGEGEARRMAPADSGSLGGGAPKVSTTALWVAHMRAEEARARRPLIEDPYAARLAGAAGRAYAEEYVAASRRTGALFDPIVRAKFVEDILAAESGRIGQVVVLGAGMDTRAYRMRLHESTAVFEVDFAQTFEYKERVLAAAGAAPVCRRVAVPVDFSVTDDADDAVWHRRLAAAGFDASRPCVVTIEGLLLYLRQAEVDALLENLSRLCAPGSIVVGDAMNEAMLQWELYRPVLDFMQGKGSPFVWGYESAAAWCGKWALLGFACEMTSMVELNFRYRRPQRISLGKAVGLTFNIAKNRFAGKLRENPTYSMFVAAKQ